MIQLPLTSDPCRTFSTVFGEDHFQVTTRWNERASVWTLDLADASTGELLVSALPLVLGADLLKSVCPRLGSLYLIDTAAESGYGTEAGPEDLGTRVQLIWLALGEVVA